MDHFTSAGNNGSSGADWPELDFEAAKDTWATVHMWLQIVGKIRLVRTPWVNHSWHVALYVTARGLTSSPIPYGGRLFQIDFDFIGHRLLVQTGEGARATLALRPRSVADFCEELLGTLSAMGLELRINTTPSEVADGIPFEQDRVHASYDPDHAHRLWRALLQADRVLKRFRAGYAGKCSPVHLFWGSFDLAVTRFSGRAAPPHPAGVPNLPDWVAREAYSHEVSSCGFWPGAEGTPYALFYCYAYPEPPGFPDAAVRPAGAFYDSALREFILPYEAVRRAQSPDATLLEFLQSAYAAAADLAGWGRQELEYPGPHRTVSVTM